MKTKSKSLKITNFSSEFVMSVKNDNYYRFYKRLIHTVLMSITLLLLSNHVSYSQCSLKANFILNSSSAYTFTFMDSSSWNSNYNARSLYWDFGDGTTSSLQNPSHTYSKAGNYSACLTVYQSSIYDSSMKDSVRKCSSQVCKNITVLTDTMNICINPAKIDSTTPCPYYLVYAPVCGCNGITYDNECEAQKAGVINWTKGACNPQTTCIDSSIIFANYTIKCTKQYDPVCGCNGITYGNDCEAKKAGVMSWIKGACGQKSVIKVSPLNPTVNDNVKIVIPYSCSAAYKFSVSVDDVNHTINLKQSMSSTQPCDNITAFDTVNIGKLKKGAWMVNEIFCTFDPYTTVCNTMDSLLFYVSGIDSAITCINPYKIDSTPCPLYLVYAPVCGCDGKTYNNECEAQNAGVISWTKGACKPQTTCIDSSIILANYTINCTKQNDPVCGCNGITYGNDCEAKKAGVISWTKGACKLTGSCDAKFYIYLDSLDSKHFYVVNQVLGDNSYLWDFGDGITSTDPYPTHTYAKSGTFSICLTISSRGVIPCTDTKCQTLAFKTSSSGGATITVISPEKATGISEKINDEVIKLEIYPNPNNGSFHIVTGIQSSNPIAIKIVNLLGETIYEKSGIDPKASLEVNILNSHQGMYFVQIQSEGKVYNSKMIIH